MGGVADSQTRSKPLKPPKSPRKSPFRTELHLSFSQISQKSWGGWVNRFVRDLPKKNVFFTPSRKEKAPLDDLARQICFQAYLFKGAIYWFLRSSKWADHPIKGYNSLNIKLILNLCPFLCFKPMIGWSFNPFVKGTTRPT